MSGVVAKGVSASTRAPHLQAGIPFGVTPSPSGKSARRDLSFPGSNPGGVGAASVRPWVGGLGGLLPPGTHSTQRDLIRAAR